ncbi:hypothetical protein BaRGS_00020552 [Batillaria attramentaria]|uniref:NIF3-like protein 1 n=1 Tax=Batillaria attramentaria TaxID=370345 RepID=A0ABD0KN00_9CAEN
MLQFVSLAKPVGLATGFSSRFQLLKTVCYSLHSVSRALCSYGLLEKSCLKCHARLLKRFTAGACRTAQELTVCGDYTSAGSFSKKPLLQKVRETGRGHPFYGQFRRFQGFQASSAQGACPQDTLRANSPLQTSTHHRQRCSTVQETGSMELQEVVAVLKEIASPSLAGSWDNVGLLVEPSPPHQVRKILLTNDLTPPVMEEAVDEKVNMIVSYHPPIFAPLKRITQNSWKERIVGKCLENRIAMFSPHTSWDAAADGVNDWLIRACGDVTDLKPLEQTEAYRNGHTKKLSFITSSTEVEKVTVPLQGIPGVEILRETLSRGNAGDADMMKLSLTCAASTVATILNELQKGRTNIASLECSDMAKLPSLGFGMGRVGQLNPPVAIETVVSNIKKHLGLQHVQLARTEGKAQISTVAVCAGSGSSVLRGVTADLYLTGEMSHHEILDAVYRGTHVIVCNHSNTERGFLQVMQSRLSGLLGGKVEVVVSQIDRDPLTVV